MMKKVIATLATGIVTAALIWSGVSPPVATTAGNAVGTAAGEIYEANSKD